VTGESSSAGVNRGSTGGYAVPGTGPPSHEQPNSGGWVHCPESGYERDALCKLLDEADVPATPVNTVDQVMNDPQTIERGIIQHATHARLGEIPVIGTPLKFSRMTPGVRQAAPLRGEHTDGILADCGYSDAQISELREKKIIL